ncbi:MAG: preprotein translocase subunit SecE [Gaiellaceae bacterium]
MAGASGGELAVAGAGGRGGEKPPVRLSPQPGPRPESGPRPATKRRWGAGGNFVRESIGELRKVEWPGQSQVVQGTVVVIIAMVIIGTYLYVLDQIFNKFVTKILLGQ